jgi:TRAP-type mannitol/chloroaromatic compound transport system permease large subunit
LAIPLFVYMGVMLEKSRVAEDMLEVIGHLSGSLREGMAVALIAVGVLMGASTGIVGATVVTLTLLTMPVLLRRGYDGGLAAGAICASGTLKISAMIFFVLIGSQIFSNAFRGLDGEDLIKETLALVPGGETGARIFLMQLLFILGCFLEWIEISYIALPLLLSFFKAQWTDIVWLATQIALNPQTSCLTPPFGWALFFMKGAAPPGVTTAIIYRGVVPFIAVQRLAVAVLFMWPRLATWLPKAIGW